jgi:hypothetical protein
MPNRRERLHVNAFLRRGHRCANRGNTNTSARRRRDDRRRREPGAAWHSRCGVERELFTRECPLARLAGPSTPGRVAFLAASAAGRLQTASAQPPRLAAAAPRGCPPDARSPLRTLGGRGRACAGLGPGHLAGRQRNERPVASNAAVRSFPAPADPQRGRTPGVAVRQCARPFDIADRLADPCVESGGQARSGPGNAKPGASHWASSPVLQSCQKESIRCGEMIRRCGPEAPY